MNYNIKLYIKNSFIKGTTINDYNLKSLIVVGSFAHPLFAAIHLYIFKIPWDSMTLKCLASLICFLLITKNKWPKKIQPLFPIYWHLMLIYNLSFLITFTALNNNLILTWPIWIVIMLFIQIMFVPHWLMFLIDLSIGVSLAFFFHNVFDISRSHDPNTFNLDYDMQVYLYLLTFIFAIIAGLIFSYSNAKGIASEERAKIFKSLAGSIAHELRNPLNTINLLGNQINELATELDKSNGNKYHIGYGSKNSVAPSFTTITTAKSKFLHLTSHITDAISNANNIINIILSDLSEKSLDPTDFFYLKPSKILPDIIAKYSYKNDLENIKVNLILPKKESDDFLFKAAPDRFVYIMFNLIKNALYYLDEYPDSSVTIGSQVRDFDGTEYNVIYVNDTGPGIPPQIIPKLFGDFYTSGKKDGTGLGLSFCKRNMQAFGGDIICESEFGKWTRFSLLFPKVSKEEEKNFELENKKHKILLVDDQKINLITIKSKIERILSNISCDAVSSGLDAIKMAKQNKYQLILMDIEMPEINGIETTKRIRSYDKEIPIIALTSLSKESFLEKINNHRSNKKDFNYYISKTSADNILYRGLTKWMINIDDDLSYVGTKEQILETLQGKKVILADDQDLNRMITKNSLQKNGLVVTEAKDGKELLKIYKNSLDEQGISSFDAILTDINMSPYDGDEAAKKLRKIENINNISHHNEIPIIALSGDGDKEDIHHFFDCQMTDYFIKGNSPDLLLKIIANYISKKDDTKYEMITHQIKNDENFKEECLANIRIFDRKNIEFFDKDNQNEILNLFLKESSEIINNIQEGVKENNIKKILINIHSIKGISLNIGANRLFYFAKALESALIEDTQIQNWINHLEAIYLELKAKIELVLKEE